MQTGVWKKAIGASADPKRAGRYFEHFQALDCPPWLHDAPAPQAQVLSSLFAGSQFLPDLLTIHPDWFQLLDVASLQNPRQEQGLRREVQSWLQPLLQSKSYREIGSKLRLFKQRELLRIAARDLSGLGNVSDLTREISNVADICLQSVWQMCLQSLTDKFGSPFHAEVEGQWQPTAFSILGMGKLGGQELNYSSDIDVIFVYSAEGFVFKTPPKSRNPGNAMASHQFFKQLAEAIIAEFTRPAAEGILFRIDLRLRPEGKNGPLARSLASYENYYAQWGQTWERMMLIKARGVAGDKGLAAEFLEMVQPFRYPRSIGEQIPHEVAAMKQRIESEVVKAGEMDRNVKLGRGGIREIEFIAQIHQVLQGGRTPFLQSSQTLPTLQKLVQYQLISATEAADLTSAYEFLRKVEHRLQMEENRQTHTIPTDRAARERLARLMGFKSLAAFEKTLLTHTDRVRAVYDKFIKLDPQKPGLNFPADFEESEAEWKSILVNHSFQDPDRSFKLIKEFVQGPGFGHVSSRTTSSSLELLARLFAMCPRKNAPNQKETIVLSDPDRVIARLDSYVSAYGARSMLYEAWVGNLSLFRLLLMVFDRSEFLAELAIQAPDLIDELEQSGQLRRQKTAELILADLRHGLNDEDQFRWIRRYHQAEFMRIGARDILGLANPRQTQDELTALADACLQYAVEVIVRRRRLKAPPFVILGLGKLGGHELVYGSDLDIIFVAPDEAKNLPTLQKLALEVMDLLSRRTENGAPFATDARLRPDGEKGLLVNTLNAYREYYRRRAMLWEIQSLSRVRAIAGNSALGQAFEQMASEITDFSKARPALNAYTPDWKQEIHKMRLRIENERTPAGKKDLAIKTGPGGLMDVEFIAQVLNLAHGWRQPNTLKTIEMASAKGALPKKSSNILLDNYQALMAVERILRRWSYASESVLPSDPAPLYRVAVRCGFSNTDDFLKGLLANRFEIRGVYSQFFSAATAASSIKSKFAR